MSFYPHRCEKCKSALQLCHRSGSSLSTAWENMLRSTLESYLVDIKITAPALVRGPLWAAGWISALTRFFNLHKGTIFFVMAFVMGYRQTFAPALGAPPPPCFSATLVYAGLFLSHFFNHSSASQLLCSIFYPFINVRICQHHLWSKLWTTGNPFWSHLASHR